MIIILKAIMLTTSLQQYRVKAHVSTGFARAINCVKFIRPCVHINSDLWVNLYRLTIVNNVLCLSVNKLWNQHCIETITRYKKHCKYLIIDQLCANVKKMFFFGMYSDLPKTVFFGFLLLVHFALYIRYFWFKLCHLI